MTLTILMLIGCVPQYRVYYEWSSTELDSLEGDPRLMSSLTSYEIEGTSDSLSNPGHIFMFRVLAPEELPHIRLDSVVAYVRDDWSRDLTEVWATSDIVLQHSGTIEYSGTWHFPRGEYDLRRLRWRVYMTLQTPERDWQEGYAIDYDVPVRTMERPRR